MFYDLVVKYNLSFTATEGGLKVGCNTRRNACSHERRELPHSGVMCMFSPVKLDLKNLSGMPQFPTT